MSFKKLADLISNHRKFLMAFATIWVLLFHGSIQTDNSLIQMICYNGYAGVDIFLIISGFGVYKSLQKDNNTLSFYKKRALRIIPKYYIILIIYTILAYLKVRRGLIIYHTEMHVYQSLFLNATFFYFLHGYKLVFNWYIFMIVYMYLLSPFMYKLINKLKDKAFIILISIFLFLYGLNIIYANEYEFTFTLSIRTFDFLLGMYIAYKSNDENHKINIPIILIISIIAFIFHLYPPLDVGYLNHNYGYSFITMGIVILGLIIILLWIGEKIKDLKLYSYIERIGELSFEIYLINVALYIDALNIFGSKLGYGNITRISFMIINIISAYIFSKLYDKIIKKPS